MVIKHLNVYWFIKLIKMAKTELYLIASDRYFNGVVKILEDKVKNNKIIYVTTNKTYKHLLEKLNSASLNQGNFFFIDCISKSSDYQWSEKERKKCLFIESPESLTAIGIAISKGIQYFKGAKILLLDSLSTLMVYHNANSIIKFSNFLVNLMQTYNLDLIILAIKSDEDKEAVKEIESFVDEVKRI